MSKPADEGDDTLGDRLLTEGTADGVVVVDRDHRIAAANEQAGALVGAPWRELAGRPIADFLSSQDLDRALSCFDALSPTERVDDVVRLRAAGGLDGDVEVRVRRMSDGRVLVLLRDMHALRRQERALRVVSEALAVAPGPAFVERLATSLREALSADYAFVAEVSESAETLTVHAMAGPNGVARGLTYPLEGVLSRRALEAGDPIQRVPGDELGAHPLLAEHSASAWRMVPLAEPEGQVLGLIGIMGRRITTDPALASTLDLVASRAASEIRRLRMEEALRRSERHLRALVQASSRFVWSVDASGDPTLHAERTWAAVSGQEMTSEDNNDEWLRAVVPEDRERVAFEWGQAFSAQVEHELSYRVHAPGGETRHLQVRGVPIFDDLGEFEGFIGTIEDVTALRRAAEELRQQNDVLQVLRAVPEATNHGVGFLECVHVAVEVNCRAWGFKRGQVFVGNDADGGLERALADQVPGVDAWSYIAESKVALWVDGGPHVLVPIRLGSEAVALLHFVDPKSGDRDATVAEVLSQVGMQLARAYERERQEEEVRVAQQRAFEAQKLEAIGRLAGGVAHEFNNLLMVVLGEADLALREEGLPPSVKESLHEIRSSGRLAADVTAQLLSFSRRGIAGRSEPINLCSVLTDLDHLAERLVGEEVVIETRVDVPVEDCLVHVNRGQIEQALINMVVNAWEAMGPGGTIAVQVTIESLTEQAAAGHGVDPGRYLVVAMRDDGEGIPDEHLEAIFEPFFTTKDGGSGLGLASAYGTVASAGGFMSVDSELGRGTEFKIYLPCATRAGESEVAPPADNAERPLVWVVEDDDSVRWVTERMLAAGGYSVESVGGSRELEALLECDARPDILLTDCMLPGSLGGRDIDTLVRRSAPDVATVFMSGYTDDVLLRQGKLEPGQVFLPKPFHPEELFEALREARAKAHGRDPSAAGGPRPSTEIPEVTTA